MIVTTFVTPCGCRITTTSCSELGTAAMRVEPPQAHFLQQHSSQQHRADRSATASGTSSLDDSTGADGGIAAWNTNQSPKNATVADREPRTSQDDPVPVSGSVALVAAASGPSVRTDGYEGWTGMRDQLPGSVIRPWKQSLKEETTKGQDITDKNKQKSSYSQRTCTNG